MDVHFSTPYLILTIISGDELSLRYNMTQYRIEHDTMGEVKVPANALWGAQTERSRNNFKIGPEGSMPVEIIRAFGVLKKSAARTNRDLGVLSAEKCELICTVCDEIIAGKLDAEFPLVIWQTGSGTQSNMNVNEVIANRAHVLSGGKLDDEKKVLHPNDDVNKSQSSNDTFPTAMSIAVFKQVVDYTLPGIQALKTTLKHKARDFENIVKIGRTHFMDATPLTLGQEFSAYVQQLENGVNAINRALPVAAELALGGTAVGTGLNTPAGYSELVAKYIAEETALPFVTAPNKFEALAAHDAMVELHGADVAISFAASQGHFELNVFKPVIASNMLQSARLLGQACLSFNDNCAVGIEPNLDNIQRLVDQSLMLVTALNTHIGYENAAKIAKKAHKENTTLKEAALALELLTEAQFNEWVRPELMVGNPKEVIK